MSIRPFSLNVWQDIAQMLQYDFMVRAILAGLALSVASGLVGYFVVVRHQAFAGESLSDVAFTGAVGGAALGINPLMTLILTTGLAALLMGRLGERLRGRDVAVGTTLAWALGLGALFLSLFRTHSSGKGTGFSGVTILFGNIIGISPQQLSIIVWASLAVFAMVAVFGRPLLFASLDPDVAKARGVPVQTLGLLFMVLLAVTVSVATLAVGAMLIFALILLPAATAQRLTARPVRALILGVVLALSCVSVGITTGFYSGQPISVCISGLAFVMYVLVSVTPMLRRVRLTPVSPSAEPIHADSSTASM